MKTRTAGAFAVAAVLLAGSPASAQLEVRAPLVSGGALTASAVPAFAAFAPASLAAASPAAAASLLSAAAAPAASAFAAAPLSAAAAAPVPALAAVAASAAAAPLRAFAAVDAEALAALSAAAMDGSAGKGGSEPAHAPAPDLRKMEVLKLRPTQMSVGLREVDEKVGKLQGKNADEYLKARPVPVVLGPGGRVYLIDHHHLARAAWEAGISHMHVEVKADLSGLSDDDFWARMKKENWVYPYDQLGGGPHDPENLPETVRGLADDPYRSVAGEVRERGGYEKNDAPFSEFLWAQFFRERLKAHPTYHDFESAVTEALALAKTEAAKHLPGWSGGR